uniref:RNA-directed RNA polymerase L n=1 Tax=Halophytophthora RNA virus 2 TaxID=2717544 RepID=A0A7D5JSR3_9VIRU|nr:RNA-dependent RNA polymerase [Halophytophthora RNA virus 2]
MLCKAWRNHAQLSTLHDKVCEEDWGIKDVDCLIHNFKMFTNNLVKLADDYFMGTLPNKSMFPGVIKSYFKFRHDLLFHIFLLSIHEDPIPFDTDVPFSKFEIDSNKTPDYIFESDETTYVFENSVSTDMDKSRYQKGADNDTSIYRDELEKLEKKTKKPVVFVPVFFETKENTNNWNECWNLMSDLSIFEERSKIALDILITEVPNLRLLDRYNYMSFKGSDVVLSATITSVAGTLLREIEGCGLIEKGKTDQTISTMVNKEAISSLNSHRFFLIEELSYRRPDRKYKVVLAKKKPRIFSDESGLRPNRWIKMLNENLDVTFFKNCKLFFKGKEINPVGYQPFETVTQKWVSPDYHPVSNHDHCVELPSADSFEEDEEQLVYSLVDDEFKYTTNLSHKGLSSNVYNDGMIDDSVDVLVSNSAKLANEIELDSPQNPFTLPFAEPSALVAGEGTVDWVTTSDPLSLSILSQLKKGNYVRTAKVDSGLLEEKIKAHKKVRSIMARHMDGKAQGMKFNKLKNLLNKEEKAALDEMQNADKAINKATLKSIRSTDTERVRLSKEIMKTYGKPSNFRDHAKKGVKRGIKSDIWDESNKFVHTSIDFMDSEANFEIEDKILELGTDTKEMIQLKETMMTEHTQIHKEFNGLKVAHQADFVQRFCYTLLYFSQKKSTGSDFMHSNLGYKNVLLLVKGGKKIWNTQKSRVFKLWYPVPGYFSNFKKLFSPSTSFHYIKGQLYMETSWSTFEEKVLEDKSFFYYKTCSQYVNYRVRNKNQLMKKDKVCCRNILWNVLLSFNNRRSTEANLGALRNLFANCLGQYTCYPELVAEFAYCPSDVMQYYILHSLMIKLKKTVKALSVCVRSNFATPGIHPFSGAEIIDENDFTHLLYSTYAMTKAPYNQRVEQSRNLVKVMKVHESFEESVGEKEHVPFFRKTNKEGWDCFDNDFSVNYRYAFSMGTLLSGILKANNVVPEVHNKWVNLVTKPFTAIIKSSGLRGKRDTDQGFFGRKGPEVVAEELTFDYQKRYDTDRNSVGDILRNPDSLSEKKVLKSLDDLNITILDKINEYSDQGSKFSFHAVDKTQRNGGREIYVMSLETKPFCWTLEQIFAYICKFIDNELISIPSNKRLHTVHSRLFERSVDREQVKFFLTLDCRRWGPMSVFLKYTYMILGASEVLPKSLVMLMLYVTKKYFEKEIFVSKGTYEVFSKNLKNSELLKYFEEAENTHFFVMPYSFIMGIFNYLSSMMHALNQIDATRRITRRLNESYNGNISFYMDAHSDDSGGYIMCNNIKNKEVIVAEAINEYEYWLKQLNHMLSIKKCVVSDCYFELLSILYVNNKLLPVVPKFFSAMELKPTMQGYSADMSQSYSKCIELLSVGATFSEAFYATRIYSEMVRRFYHMDFSSRRPVNCFGGVFAHPAIIMLLGSLADSARLYKVDPILFNKYQMAVKVMTQNDRDSYISNGFKPTFKIDPSTAQAKVSEVIGTFFGESLNNEVFTNVSFKHSFLYLASFTKMINNTGFVASLNYNTNTRRLTKIFHTQKAPVYKIFGVSLSLDDLVVLIENYALGVTKELNAEASSFVSEIEEKTRQIDEKKQQILYDFLIGEANNVYDYLSDTITETIRVETQHLTCKPCTVDIDLSPISINLNESLESIYYFGTEEFRFFNLKKDLSRQKSLCHRAMDLIGAEYDTYEKFMFYMRKLQKYNCNLHMYSYVNSDNRAVKNYLDLFGLIETNTMYGKKITKVYKAISEKYGGLMQTNLSDPVLIEELKAVKLDKLMRNGKIKRDFEVNLTRQISKSFNEDCESLTRSPLNVSNFYSWQSRSKKLSSHWFGSSQCLLMINGCLVNLTITSGILTQIECNDLDLVDASFIRQMKNFVENSEIRIKRSISDYTNAWHFGENEGEDKFDIERKLSSTYCPIKLYQKDYFHHLKSNSYKKIDPFTLHCIGKPFSVKILYSDLVLSKSDVAEHNFSPNELRKLGLKNFFMTEATHSDRFELVENLDHTELYSRLIKNKLYKRTPFIQRLRAVDEYEPIEKQLIEVLIQKNVNPQNIPDSAYEVLAQQLEADIHENKLKDLIIDITNCTNEDMLQNFISKWGIGETSVLRLYDQSLNAKAFENPELFRINYRPMSIKAVDCILKALDSCFDDRLVNKFNKIYNDLPKPVSHSEINSFWVRLLWNNNSKRPNNDFHVRNATQLISCVFEDKRSMSNFKSLISADPLLSSLPLSADYIDQWVRLIYKLTMGDRPRTFADMAQLSKDYRARNLGKKTEQLPYNVGFIGKLPKLPLKPTKVKIDISSGAEVGSINYRCVTHTLSKPNEWFRMFSAYEPEVLDYEASYNNCDEIEDFIDDSCMDFAAGAAVYREFKEDYEFEPIFYDLNKHRNWKDSRLKNGELCKSIDLPNYFVLGKVSLDYISTFNPFYLLITDTIPEDYKYQPSGRVTVYRSESLSFANSYLIFAYNLPWEINGLKKVDATAFSVTHSVKRNPKFSYYIDGSAVVNDGDITQDYQYQRYMTAMSSTTIGDNAVNVIVLEESLKKASKQEDETLKNMMLNEVLEKAIGAYKRGELEMLNAKNLIKNAGFEISDEFFSKLLELPDPLLKYYVTNLKHRLGIKGQLLKALATVDVKGMMKNVTFEEKPIQENLAFGLKNNYMHEQNDYNPISGNVPLSRELQIAFGSHVGILANRNLKLRPAEKTQIRHQLSGLKSDFKSVLMNSPAEEMLKFRKYTIFIDFMMDLAMNAETVEKHGDRSVFDEFYTDFIEKYTEFSSLSSDEEVSYLDDVDTDFVQLAFMR